MNLEIAATKEMLGIVLRNKPNFVCIVPENRKEITTEGGLNIKKNNKIISTVIKNNVHQLYHEEDWKIANQYYMELFEEQIHSM